MFCTKCGSELNNVNAKYCSKCGAPVENDENTSFLKKNVPNIFIQKKYLFLLLIVFLAIIFSYFYHTNISNNNKTMVSLDKQGSAVDPSKVDVREYLHKDAEIIKVTYSEIIDNKYKDIIVHSKTKQTKNDTDYYTIISLDKKDKKFKKIFETSTEQPGGFQEISVDKIFGNDLSAIILSWGHGNTGGIANNIVYGAPKGKVENLLQTTSQKLYFKNGKIIEPNWDQAKYYSWDGNKLQATPVLLDLERKEYDDNSVIVEYYLNDNDEVVLKNNIQKIDMKIGQKLFLARINFGVPCKILYPGDAVKFEKDDFGYYELADKPGNYKITINVMGSKRYKKNIDLNITE